MIITHFMEKNRPFFLQIFMPHDPGSLPVQPEGQVPEDASCEEHECAIVIHDAPASNPTCRLLLLSQLGTLLFESVL